jgi:hypothetical protein
MKKINHFLLIIASIATISILLQGCNEDEGSKGYVKPPQAKSQLSYFPFAGNMKDIIGSHTPLDVNVKNLTFGVDRFGKANSAGEFDGTTTIVEIPAGEQYMKHNNLTVSFWIKSNSTKDGQFIMGLAGWKGFYFDISNDWSGLKFTSQFLLSAGGSDSEDIYFSGTGETKDNGGWQGYTFQKEVLAGVGEVYLKDKWVHVVCAYDATTQVNTMYLNGEKVMQTDFNLWPTGNPKVNTIGVTYDGNIVGGGNNLALGFIQGSINRIILDDWADPADLYSNHFKGLMDDLRIFSVALTEAEVAKLYNDEKL